MPRTLVKDRFDLDDMGPYEGVHDPTERWNGWACPLFTEEVARQIMADINAQPHDEHDTIRVVERDGKVAFEFVDMQSADPAGEVYEVVEQSPEGLYMMGGYCYVWSEVQK